MGADECSEIGTIQLNSDTTVDSSIYTGQQYLIHTFSSELCVRLSEWLK